MFHEGSIVQQSHTEAIRLAEKLRHRTDAVSGAATSLAAASRSGGITPDEIYQLLDVIAMDMRATADRLLEVLDHRAADSPSGDA